MNIRAMGYYRKIWKYIKPELKIIIIHSNTPYAALLLIMSL